MTEDGNGSETDDGGIIGIIGGTPTGGIDIGGNPTGNPNIPGMPGIGIPGGTPGNGILIAPIGIGTPNNGIMPPIGIVKEGIIGLLAPLPRLLYGSFAPYLFGTLNFIFILIKPPRAPISFFSSSPFLLFLAFLRSDLTIDASDGNLLPLCTAWTKKCALSVVYSCRSAFAKASLLSSTC